MSQSNIEELINSSGNSFHAKVARWLNDSGWHVVVSPYYMDQTQLKAREIDLVAEKDFDIEDDVGRFKGHLAVRLFLECKYVSSEAAFWFAEKDALSAKELVNSVPPFKGKETWVNRHHYLSQSLRVAKLFASTKGKAPENEPFYKALNQILNATVSMRGKRVTIPKLRKLKRRPKATLEYPVLVCNSFSELYGVDFYGDSPPKAISDNFQLEVRYAYLDRNQRQQDDYFLIDVIAFDRMADFEKALTEDAGIALDILSRT